MVLNDTFLIIGGRNLAKELKFFNDKTVPEKFDQSILVNNFEHNKIIFVNGLVSKLDFNYEEKDKIEISDSYESKDLDLKNPLLYLNNAFKYNYLKLTIKENYSLNKPLIIYNFTNKKLSSSTINQRIDFILKKNSNLKLINNMIFLINLCLFQTDIFIMKIGTRVLHIFI